MKRGMKKLNYKIELHDMFEKGFKYYCIKLRSVNVLKMKYPSITGPVMSYHYCNIPNDISLL